MLSALEIRTYIAMHRPTAIYVGRVEMQKLGELGQASGIYAELGEDSDLSHVDVAECCGVPVYRVAVENHFGYGHTMS